MQKKHSSIPSDNRKRRREMKNTALLIIDVQNDYFANGRMALPGAEEAAARINEVLIRFRAAGVPVFHIQHESLAPDAFFFLPETEGQKIHRLVTPIKNEQIIVKNYPNSFRDTDLLARLTEMGIERLIITGMMTFMCVDATTRAAKDLGFECYLLHDCTATPSTEYGGVRCSAEQAQAAFLSALSWVCDKVTASTELADITAQSK